MAKVLWKMIFDEYTPGWQHPRLQRHSIQHRFCTSKHNDHHTWWFWKWRTCEFCSIKVRRDTYTPCYSSVNWFPLPMNQAVVGNLNPSYASWSWQLAGKCCRFDQSTHHWTARGRNWNSAKMHSQKKEYCSPQCLQLWQCCVPQWSWYNRV